MNLWTIAINQTRVSDSFLKLLYVFIEELREKGRDLTQSYDKSPYTNRNVKRAK